MTDERPWYQRGSVAIVILILIVLLGPLYYERYRDSQLAYVRLQLSGQVERPLLASPTLHVNVWHQHAGNLRNGVLKISAKGKHVMGEDETTIHVHSFEVWEPNEESALAFEFPLTEFDPDEEIAVFMMLQAKDCHVYYAMAKWKGQEWTSFVEQ
ncbi:MAG: hypothetical protein R3C18_08200 [Planctomycetaceae bacterium]